MVNQQDTRIWIALCSKSLKFSFSFLHTISFYRFLWTFRSFSLVLWESIVMWFPLKFCAWNWSAASQNRSPCACPTFDRFVCNVNAKVSCPQTVGSESGGELTSTFEPLDLTTEIWINGNETFPLSSTANLSEIPMWRVREQILCLKVRT